jgi:hypothetical protein
MATLTKIDILKPRPLKTEIVPVPEWGGEVIVQEMTAAQRDEFETFALMKREAKDESPKGIRVSIIINTVVDENGKPLFTDLDAPDLAKKPGTIIDRIASVGLRLSGMTEAVVEEQSKNSETVPVESSSSDSVVN